MTDTPVSLLHAHWVIRPPEKDAIIRNLDCELKLDLSVYLVADRGVWVNANHDLGFELELHFHLSLAFYRKFWIYFEPKLYLHLLTYADGR